MEQPQTARVAPVVVDGSRGAGHQAGEAGAALQCQTLTTTTATATVIPRSNPAEGWRTVCLGLASLLTGGR